MPKARKPQSETRRKKNLAFITGRNEIETKRFYLLNLFSVIDTPRGSVCYVHILTEINIDDDEREKIFVMKNKSCKTDMKIK